MPVYSVTTGNASSISHLEAAQINLPSRVRVVGVSLTPFIFGAASTDSYHFAVTTTQMSEATMSNPSSMGQTNAILAYHIVQRTFLSGSTNAFGGVEQPIYIPVGVDTAGPIYVYAYTLSSNFARVTVGLYVGETTGPRGPAFSPSEGPSATLENSPRDTPEPSVPGVKTPTSSYGVDLTKTVGPPELTSAKDVKLLDRHVLKTGQATRCCERQKLQLVSNIIQPYNDLIDTVINAHSASSYALVLPAIGPNRIIELIPGKETQTLGALRLAGGVVFLTIAGYILAEIAAQARALSALTLLASIIEAAVSKSTQTESCRKCMERESLGQKNPRMRTIWYESKRRRNGETFVRYNAGQRGSVTTRKPGRPKKVPFPLKDPFDKTP